MNPQTPCKECGHTKIFHHMQIKYCNRLDCHCDDFKKPANLEYLEWCYEKGKRK
jgi:hypothetical protein